ncbi:MAG: hypothetical protein Q4D38_15015 [Planctomycetia bacterium]|nr:hypothetical protein [Planctomycetia bacterium]
MNLQDIMKKIRQFFESLFDDLSVPEKDGSNVTRDDGKPKGFTRDDRWEYEMDTQKKIENEDFLNVEHPDLEETFDLEEETVPNANPVAIENPIESVPEEAEKEDSLLDNRPLVKLTENVVRLGDDIARHLPTLSQEAAEFAQYVSGRLDEMLLRCGVEPIEDETSFHIVRHQTVPPRNIPNGTPITATLVPGLRLEERVLRRAKVTVELDVSPQDESQDEPQDDTIE